MFLTTNQRKHLKVMKRAIRKEYYNYLKMNLNKLLKRLILGVKP